MSQDKYRKALENCTTDSLKLRKKMKELEQEIKDSQDTIKAVKTDLENSQANADKIKRALQNCTTDALKLRKKMKSPEMRIRRKSRRSKRRSRR
jgi:chromosome segregation ATPase